MPTFAKKWIETAANAKDSKLLPFAEKERTMPVFNLLLGITHGVAIHYFDFDC